MSEEPQSDLWRPENVDLYAELWQEIESTKAKSYSEWCDYMRAYGAGDLFFLLRYILSTKNPDWLAADTGRQRLDHPFALDFCREIETDEDDTLFIKSREHIKSTASTFGRTFQIIINDSNETIAILTDTGKLSKKFVKRIKVESEKNALLYKLWPEVFWGPNPAKEGAETWALGDPDPGLTFRRSVNVAEATVTPVGLDTAIDTGPHYTRRRYDDIVTARNTKTPSLMKRTKDNLKSSQSLGKEGGHQSFVGTFYHPLDAYHDMIKKERVNVRVTPCWRRGPQGTNVPVFYSMKYLLEKKKQCGDEEFAIQWLCNPSLTGETEQIDEQWLRYYKSEEMAA